MEKCRRKRKGVSFAQARKEKLKSSLFFFPFNEKLLICSAHFHLRCTGIMQRATLQSSSPQPTGILRKALPIFVWSSAIDSIDKAYCTLTPKSVSCHDKETILRKRSLLILLLNSSNPLEAESGVVQLIATSLELKHQLVTKDNTR